MSWAETWLSEIFETPGIGLRNRFFITIFFVMLVVTAGSIYLYSFFLKKERLALIDQQVRQTATALIDSELGDLRKIDFEQAENIISEELGDSRIGKFFIIRNSRNETIFESASATLLPIAETPKDTQWFEISAKGKYIRGLNLKLPRLSDRTLQVGLVLDDSLINPSYLSKTSLIISFVVLALGIAASFFLTSFLLRPIARLENFLTKLTITSRKQMLPLVPDSIAKNPNANSRDEFNRVVAGLNTLIQKVNKNHEFSRILAYQMAHELKTPLVLANVEIERLQKKLDLKADDVEGLISENTKISETINSFLGWAELENSSDRKRLYLIPLSGFVQEIVDRFQKDKDRIRLGLQSDFILPANPQHLEQLILNLLQNALRHSDAESEVIVRVTEDQVIIEDRGPGIPPLVLERMGEPFNKGDPSTAEWKGHGLGLAWIMSICRHYGWNITITPLIKGTSISIQFHTNPPD